MRKCVKHYRLDEKTEIHWSCELRNWGNRDNVFRRWLLEYPANIPVCRHGPVIAMIMYPFVSIVLNWVFDTFKESKSEWELYLPDENKKRGNRNHAFNHSEVEQDDWIGSVNIDSIILCISFFEMDQIYIIFLRQSHSFSATLYAACSIGSIKRLQQILTGTILEVLRVVCSDNYNQQRVGE